MIQIWSLSSLDSKWQGLKFRMPHIGILLYKTKFSILFCTRLYLVSQLSAQFCRRPYHKLRQFCWLDIGIQYFMEFFGILLIPCQLKMRIGDYFIQPQRNLLYETFDLLNAQRYQSFLGQNSSDSLEEFFLICFFYQIFYSGNSIKYLYV